MKKGLVLGGGGVVGIAWESGLLAGLREGGIDLRDADVFVGTSAGSFVGSQLASGEEFTMEAVSDESPSDEPSSEESLESSLDEFQKSLDLALLGKIFQRWSSVDEMTAEVCKEIGGWALEAPTMPEEQWIASTGGNTGLSDWPEKDVRITSVDVVTGELCVHSKATSPLHASVASSCAIPGMFPAITINGQRYMDGGVRSGTNADVLKDDALDVAVIIAPICEGTALFGSVSEKALLAEAEILRAQGAKVLTIMPLAKEKEVFGPNLMDSKAAPAAKLAGYERGLELAKEEAKLWLG